MSGAIAQFAKAQNLALSEVNDFAALAGRGVRGDIDGETYHLGNHRLVEELGLCSPALEAQLDTLERQGKTVVLLLDRSGPLALFAVADTVRTAAARPLPNCTRWVSGPSC